MVTISYSTRNTCCLSVEISAWGTRYTLVSVAWVTGFAAWVCASDARVRGRNPTLDALLTLRVAIGSECAF